jgi:hypothetical protein
MVVKRAKQARKRNRGSFAVGFDPRRHVFTQEERQRGGRSAWWRWGWWQSEATRQERSA